MTPGVFEGKYELDSLAAVLKLSNRYYTLTHDVSVFDNPDGSPYLAAVAKIIDIVTLMQASTAEDGDSPAYNFTRLSEEELYPSPLRPVARCGLSKCGFRPSDDQTYFGPFLIPANAMAAVELEKASAVLAAASTSSLSSSSLSSSSPPPLSNTIGAPPPSPPSPSPTTVPRASALAARAAALAAELKAAVRTEAIAPGGIFAYEVDGFGHQRLMDDANVPSLLSLPYVGFLDPDDPIYLATRAKLLSGDNPFYFTGTEGSGIGSIHTPFNFIWPMSVTLQALTSTNDTEIADCLRTLKNSAQGTGLMHESFFKDDAAEFTRPWFAWANSLFGELIIKLAAERPYLIVKGDGKFERQQGLLKAQKLGVELN
jgi:hypothetical protein